MLEGAVKTGQACMQLGATAPEREAALWGGEVLSCHQRAPLQGWSAELLALLLYCIMSDEQSQRLCSFIVLSP